MTVQSISLNHQDIIQVSFYAVIITTLWITEAMITGNFFKAKWKHSRVNMMFILTALPIQLFITGFVLLISNWAIHNHWGLIRFIPFNNNPWVYYISLFVLLDFCEYCYHVIMHKIDFLWKFHLVHHSDLTVDVSTTLREHPIETIVRTCFLMLWVFLLGPAVGVLILRQVFQTFSNIVAHTEFRLPKRANKIVGSIFITPNLHHVHHHYQLPYTDRNYGDVLSVWDRLFGTFGELDKKHTIFGIDTHMEPLTNSRFLNIIKIPFQKLVRKEPV